MPCTQHDEQKQQARNLSFRSLIDRSFAGLRFQDQQNLQSFSIESNAHHQQQQNQLNNQDPHHLLQRQHIQNPLNQIHPQPNQQPISSINYNQVASLPPTPSLLASNRDDLAEQIRISVQGSHVTQRSFVNQANISDVIDSLNQDVHRSIQQPMHSIDSSNFSLNRQVGIVILSSGNNSSQLNPQASSSSSSASIISPTPSSQIGAYVQPANLPYDNFSRPNMTYVVRTDEELVHESNHEVKSNTGHGPAQPAQNYQPISSTRLDQAAKTSTSQHIEPKSDSSSLKPSSSSPDNENYTAKCIPSNHAKTIDHVAQSENLEVAEKKKNSNNNNKRPLCDYNGEYQLNECTSLSRFESQPSFTSHRQVGAIRSFLYNGSSFSGFQKSKNESYEVNVKIQHVDFDSSYLCGYLCIYHLTKNNPSLTTFFDGEIISSQHPFLTRKWEATEEIDRAHWSKFEGFHKYLNTFNLDSFDYNELEKSDYVFMRWKEQFLVPDHTVKHVEGASYAGFYYICFSKRTSRINGYYFHINSEHFER